MSILTQGFTPLQFEPFGAFLTVICALVIAALVVFIFLAVWLYRDAESRGMSGGLWVVILLLASLFFSFLGLIVVLIIYLLVRGQHPYGSYPAGYGYGGYGSPYAPPGYPPPMPPPPGPAPAGPAAPAPATRPTNCKSCGAPLAPNAAFCSNCGSKV
ncbi:MAG TPA: zinc ribbon domain-containing protein [Thermoplasmata archaeon]|nr:zinc ribbon domain-containing protein [Thermoplasmata archaeon]